MDTPKIPPGCEEWEEWFRCLLQYGCVDCAQAPDGERGIRRLRAALYRGKWLDEVQRLHDGMRLKEFPGDSEDLQAAWQHAEAWRV